MVDFHSVYFKTLVPHHLPLYWLLSYLRSGSTLSSLGQSETKDVSQSARQEGLYEIELSPPLESAPSQGFANEPSFCQHAKCSAAVSHCRLLCWTFKSLWIPSSCSFFFSCKCFSVFWNAEYFPKSMKNVLQQSPISNFVFIGFSSFWCPCQIKGITLYLLKQSYKKVHMTKNLRFYLH